MRYMLMICHEGSIRLPGPASIEDDPRYRLWSEERDRRGGARLRRVEDATTVRVRLSAEAIRLARTLAQLMPDEPEALGLLALMLLHDARHARRPAPPPGGVKPKRPSPTARRSSSRRRRPSVGTWPAGWKRPSYRYLDLTALGRQETWEEPKGRAVPLGLQVGGPAMRLPDEYDEA